MEETIVITVELIAETELAVLVNDGVIETWLPKSQIYFDPPNKYNMIDIEVPEWLAEEKELI